MSRSHRPLDGLCSAMLGSRRGNTAACGLELKLARPYAKSPYCADSRHP
jgi:hypothetical protein